MNMTTRSSEVLVCILQERHGAKDKYESQSTQVVFESLSVGDMAWNQMDKRRPYSGPGEFHHL